MKSQKSIYELDINGMRNLLRCFSATLYGRTVFFLAYFLSFIAFLAFIGLIIATLVTAEDLFSPILIALSAFLVLFIFGNIYYYHELLQFSKHL